MYTLACCCPAPWVEVLQARSATARAARYGACAVDVLLLGCDTQRTFVVVRPHLPRLA